MKYTTQMAGFAATVAANQFVQYTPVTDDTSVQRIDPIISPNALAGHVHQLFGANRLAAELTYESLQQSDCTTVGASDGTGNSQDKSIYWHPAMFAKKIGSDDYMKISTGGHKLYYKDAGTGEPREPFEFPRGFRMVAGDPFMRAPASYDSGRQNITQWVCHSSGPWNQGTDGGFPTDITDCDAYPGFNGAIHFPHCWNGDDFNQADPNAHMAYPLDNIENGECPSSHPIRLPHIFMENQFNIHQVIDQIDTSTFVLAQGDNTGYGWHADFFNGWDDGAIPELIKTCPQGKYGNEDIGSCPSYKGFTGKKAEDCKLPTTYKEAVQNPGNVLPGCNPISDMNPAPRLAVSPLHDFTDQCGASSGSSGSPPVQPPRPSSVRPNPTQYSVTKAETTTMATYARPTSTAETTTTTTMPMPPPPPSGPSKQHHRGKVSCPDSHGQTIVKNGKTFEIECGVDHAAGNLAMKTAHSLGECIKFCARTAGCVDVSLSGTACYMKEELGEEVMMEGLAGAKLVSGDGTAAPPSSYGGKRSAHVHRHARGKGVF